MIHTFAGNTLDRGDVIRRAPALLKAALEAETSIFLLFSELEVLVNNEQQLRLGWLNQSQVTRLKLESEPILLGFENDIAHFALDVSSISNLIQILELGDDWAFKDCRAAAMEMDNGETGIIAQGRAQVSWHSNHQFCSKCGGNTEPQRGGLTRHCELCRTDHFPRTDPVVIMLITDGERCLLGQGHGPMVKINMYSTLAGFIEQGESIEEAVRREVKEEAGIDVGRVRYHSSQPWPFPSSLMIGCHAEALSEKITIDTVEINDARWFSKAEVKAALHSKTDGLYLPGSMAIAHHLIRTWIEDDIRFE